MKTLIKLFSIIGLLTFLVSCNDDDDQKAPGPIVYPTFSQGTGSFDNEFQVSIGSNVEDANIYYTTDGSLPSASSTQYTGPITISSDTELKAIAIAPSAGESEIGGVSYSFKTAAPTLSVDPGDIKFSQFVKLSSKTEGATIYYTLDGSDPSTDDNLFEADDSIWVDVNFDELWAIAYNDNYASSDTLKADYNIVLSEEDVDNVYWYSSADDALAGADPFLHYEAMTNSGYDITLNTSTVLDTIPLDYRTPVPSQFDVVVLADTYSSNFDLSDFRGMVLVTFNKSVEAFMDDILAESAAASTYWNYGTNGTVDWANPSTWGSESAQIGASYINADAIVEDENVMFVRRADIIEGNNGGTESDAVIVYEVKTADAQFYWVHIGPFAATYPKRASEILAFTLGKLTGE